jgi:tetratricopeptide (TPR) repeat protein
MKSYNFRKTAFIFLLACFLFCIPVIAYTDEAVRSFTLGNSFVESENYTSATEAYDQAILLEPGYYEAWNGKADALNRAGQFSDALAASSRALEFNPDYVTGWINRGQILYNIGYYYEDQANNPEKAEEYYREQLLAFEKAVQLEPANAEAWFNKGYALAGMKRYDEAITAFDTVKELDPKYPNLQLSRNQAQALLEATTPVHVRYAVPLTGIILFLIIAGGIFWWVRSGNQSKDDELFENRKSRRRKEK